jgi:ABC-type glutathione transport system ATPase component
MTAPLLDVDITAGYGKATTLQKICLELHPGDRAGVVGTSGAGKSTLVLALLGLLPWRKGWVTGHIRFEGTDLLQCTERELRRVRGRKVGLVPQSPATALNPALTLQTHFDEMWRAHAKRGPAQRDRMRFLLDRVELPGTAAFLKRFPGQISIGQAQRVMIALSLLHQPSLLIADEPTSALDVCTQQEVVRLLHDISRDGGTTLLYVSHDLVSVLQLCDRMFVMSKGVLVETVDLSQDHLQTQHDVSRQLLATLPATPLAVKQTYLSRVQALSSESAYA